MTHSPSYRRILHKMGYYDYQHGLVHRHFNQKGAWDTHLENCRSFILGAVDLYKPVKITVLGSGWLLELPIAEILEKTEEIVLIDIIHPPGVISQTADLKNINIVEEDISGGLIEEVWKKTRKRKYFSRLSSIDDIEIPQYHFSEDPGMVVSLNILTQLESLPLKLLQKKCRPGEEEITEFRKQVQMNHLKLLCEHEAVLITDVSELFTTSSGIKYEELTVVTDLPDGKITESWVWDFDPYGIDFNRKNSVLIVTAKIL